jgi:sugar phosphate isomerase/epimerase
VAQKRGEIKSWRQPPFTAASHWLKDERITGNDATPFAELDRQAEQHCRRLAELGTGMVAGIWGNFFPVPDGYSKTKATDQAVEYCGMIHKYAQKHDIVIALEPTANPRTVFPKYSDGLAFAKQLGLSNIGLSK